MRAPGRIAAFALAAAVALGCEEERMRAPAAAAGGGRNPTLPNVGGGGGPTDDAGSDPSIDGATSLDGSSSRDGGELTSVWTQCEPVDPTLVGGDEPISAVTLPADLDVTRVETTWETCSDPTIRITLSDGDCPDGYGHELVLELRVNSIIIGQNEINPEPLDTGIRVHYFRPDPLEPAGEWGTCAGAEGFVNFTDVPSWDRNAVVQGDFTLMLTPCDEIAMGNQRVDGKVYVTLQRGLSEVCD